MVEWQKKEKKIVKADRVELPARRIMGIQVNYKYHNKEVRRIRKIAPSNNY